jgi:hypothetical protein
MTPRRSFCRLSASIIAIAPPIEWLTIRDQQHNARSRKIDLKFQLEAFTLSYPKTKKGSPGYLFRREWKYNSASSTKSAKVST